MFVLLVLWAYNLGGGLGVLALFFVLGCTVWALFMWLLLFIIGSFGRPIE